ncbi:DUF2281 domain-containing protein [Variovorax rhizosphaerae]|uniref:DUF2281 domain-containing protein n=1 Tax=Variovorax rhizosphaerae TaxID=1836200 RepID=A0ABU8WUZ7_9BURK
MTALEIRLIERLKQLPPGRIAEVADFVEFLTAREQRAAAIEGLRALDKRLPDDEEMPPELEQELMEEIRRDRAERRQGNGN